MVGKGCLLSVLVISSFSMTLELYSIQLHEKVKHLCKIVVELIYFESRQRRSKCFPLF